MVVAHYISEGEFVAQVRPLLLNAVLPTHAALRGASSPRPLPFRPSPTPVFPYKQHLQVPYFPPLQSGADFTPARCAEIVRQVAKRSDLELEVRRCIVSVAFCCRACLDAPAALAPLSLLCSMRLRGPQPQCSPSRRCGRCGRGRWRAAWRTRTGRYRTCVLR